MNQDPEAEAKAEQRQVQRLLGRCMLRLQLYERLLKALLSDQSRAGVIPDLDAIREERKGQFARKTLGTLVGEFLGGYLVSGEPPDAPERAEVAGDDRAYCSFFFQVSLTPADFEQTGRSLKELVDLRNMLVHQFIDRHDLWSAEGCRVAQKALVEAYEMIDSHYVRLMELAKSHDEAMQGFAKALQSEEVRDQIISGQG